MNRFDNPTTRMFAIAAMITATIPLIDLLLKALGLFLWPPTLNVKLIPLDPAHISRTAPFDAPP